MAISLDEIVGTALTLLRQYGLADMSMRRIAKELGVAPGALYWHVKNKQGLLVEVARSLTDSGAAPVPPLQPPPADNDGDAPASPTQLLVGCARSLTFSLGPIPDAAEVVHAAYALEPSAIRPLAELEAGLRRAGAGPGHARQLAQACAHLVLGELMARQIRSNDSVRPGQQNLDIEFMLERLGAGVAP